MAALIGIWSVLVFLVLLNGFAAGIAAALHVWRSKQPRRSRILTAAAVSGLVPAAIALPAMAADVSSGMVAPLGLLVGIAVICAIAMGASLPGAVIVARKLDGPGDAYRAFE